MHHRTIQINHQPDATIFQFSILAFVYCSTCFGRFPTHHQELSDCSGTLWFYLRIMLIAVLCSWSGWPAQSRTQHDCHHDTKVKPEAATAVIELLIMDGKTSETCWAVNKRQDNKLEKLLHQVGDLFELNVKLRCQKLRAEDNVLFVTKIMQQINGYIYQVQSTRVCALLFTS